MGPRDRDLGEVFDALDALYAEIDAAHAGSSCPASTECCRFGITGKEPQVTSVELAAVRRALARRGGALSARTRALPIADDERTCALLDRDGRCSIYASRPLGCRTYFCSRATHEARVGRGELSAWVRRVQALALRHEVEGDRPRPLSRALESKPRR